MYLDVFNYDANNASIVKQEGRKDENGNTVVRLTFDNGVILIYTKTPNGYKLIDTNFELIKLVDGSYMSDLTSPKRDFNDYY